MDKKTAVEWLFEELERIDSTFILNSSDYINGKINAFEIAKGMEKETEKCLGQITEKGVIDIIGNCANCGVEFHIHKNIEELPKTEIDWSGFPKSK